MGGERHQHLGRDRAQANAQRRQQEQGGAAGAGGGQQGHGRRQQGDDNQAAVFHQVAQRHDEQQAEAVADLGQRDDQAGRARRQAGGAADRADQGLRVIQVGDDQAGRYGQQPHHGGGDILLFRVGRH